MSIVLFDLDGVIVDSEDESLKRTHSFLTDKGFKLTIEQLLPLVGGNRKSEARFYKQLFGDDIDYEALVAEKITYYKTHPVDYRKLMMPHIQETVKGLFDRGHHLCVASSSSYKHIFEVIDAFDIRPYFDYLVSGEDFDEAKPNPAVYNFCKSKYPDVAIDNFYVVEDSSAGIEAAKRAGLYCIAKKDHRFGIDQSKADIFIEDLYEVIDIVERKMSMD